MTRQPSPQSSKQDGVRPPEADGAHCAADSRAAVLLVAHAPLAGAFQALAAHPFDGIPVEVLAVDVTLDVPASEQAVARSVARLKQHQMVLVLTDVVGATPHRLALQAVAHLPHFAVVSGLNLPMLWRSVCNVPEGLTLWAQRAAEGGSRGCTPCED